MLIKPISEREFALYGLSLSRGPNFEPLQYFAGYKLGSGSACGCILVDQANRDYAAKCLRRRIDHCWALTGTHTGFKTPEAALDWIGATMHASGDPEPLPSGAKKRSPLLRPGSKGVSPEFELITKTLSHLPALMAIGECYLALPNPDRNFASDFQTNNFAARLFELYLLAAFREQGVRVVQDFESPDFLIEREGATCWVEAVTANSPEPRAGGIGQWVHAPEDRVERLTGAPAERFAKTLRSKMQREYHLLDHVRGKPFAIAIADFHASGSMVWSREALPTYLYGVRADTVGSGQEKKAVGVPIDKLQGKSEIPAGLFRDPNNAHLSGVIFSNAATLSKFNRMGYFAGWRPPGLKMIRKGHLFDRSPGALTSIPFELDIASKEYSSLWPWGETWCQELEVFHNPLAKHPISFDLLPGATHWFEDHDEIQCKTMWANNVLASTTALVNGD